MTIKLVCSDCNGVLNNVDGDYSKSGWYSNISSDNSNLYDEINKFLFRSNKKYLISSWMSGEINYKDINKIIANNFEIDYEYLNEKLVESAKNLELNWDLINIYQKYRKNGLKVYITTDNMDIFSLYTVPANNLNNYFDNIYNSSNLKNLKENNEFKLFKEIANDNNLKSEEIIIVDDSKEVIEKAKENGFNTYLYNQDTYSNFENELFKML